MDQGKKFIQEKGIALVVALFFLLILSLLGVSLLLNSEVEHATSSNYSKTVKATYAAQAGLERFKPYLLYDFANDVPDGWKNENLLVPFGTPGSLDATAIGFPGHGYFDLSNGGAITVPNDEPYDVSDALNMADSKVAALFPATTSPVYSPEAGYEIMMRNIPPNAPAADRICVQSIGFTGEARSLSGGTSRGTNVLEACYFGEDLSIWNNIVFGTHNTLGGGGNMNLHGNIHILGTGFDPDDVVFDSKADAFNCYGGSTGGNECGNQGNLFNAGLDDYLNTFQRNRLTLDAKFRVRNGLADLTNGNACVGCPTQHGGGPDMVGAYVCTDCSNGGYVGSSITKVDALEYGTYDIPLELQTIIDFPEVSDPFTDKTTLIVYDNYSDYLIGDDDGSLKPGVLGLKTRDALGSGTLFELTNNTNLANAIWAVKDTLFNENVNTASSLTQQPIDAVGLDESPVEADPVFVPTIGANETFMLVAADPARGVFIIYKEVQPFIRSGISHPRQIHGLVFAPATADMNTLTLDVDLDGSGLDGVNEDFATTLNSTNSNRLVRKVVNALWKQSQKTCGTPSCYASAGDGNLFDTTLSSQFSDDPVTPAAGNLNTAGLGNILIGYGVIQTTDALTLLDDANKDSTLTYGGKFTLFVDDWTSEGSEASLYGNINPNVSYFDSGGQEYAFPCDYNMGILASEDMEMEKQPHTKRVGAFYAGDVMHVTKQLRILGAMVADQWSFDSGGNPDLHQAMEISRCLPPYMIGGDLIPFVRSTSFVER